MVLTIEENLASSQVGREIIQSMQMETFAQNGKLKYFIQASSQTANSIQWLSQVSCSQWKQEKHILILFPLNKLTDIFRTNPKISIENLMINLIGHLPNPQTERHHIHLLKNNKNKSLEAEMTRSALEKLQDLTAEALVLFQTSINLTPIDNPGACDRVIKSTKSILELVQQRSSLPKDGSSSGATGDEDQVSIDGCYGSWYPKKSGPPISVNKNKIGLANLWQRYLMQVSKGVNVEQAKVISADPDFSSLSRTFRTYSNCDEKQAIDLLSNKTLRPNGATKDAISLGNKRPCVGPETSRKVFKVLTSTDPECIV